MELQKTYNEKQNLVKAFAESRIGGRPENQDSYGWADTPSGYAMTVCDGMGGGPGGKTASSIAVREILAGINEASKDEEKSNIIIKAIRRANMAILEAGNEAPALRGMGSTATVLLITPQSAFIAHVGDSRVYQLRGHKKIFRTFDHSMVFEMVAQKIITEEQARLSTQSNIITRALGIKPDVEVSVSEVPYEKGDRFLLCTDGIHGTMPEEELLKLATNRKRTLGAIVDDLATYVDNLGRSSGGGHDNLTLAFVETLNNSILRPSMTKQAKLLIALLGILVAISFAINMVQCNSKRNLPVPAVTSTDSTKIQQINDSILKIDTLINKANINPTHQKNLIQTTLTNTKNLLK